MTWVPLYWRELLYIRIVHFGWMPEWKNKLNALKNNSRYILLFILVLLSVQNVNSEKLAQ